MGSPRTGLGIGPPDPVYTGLIFREFQLSPTLTTNPLELAQQAKLVLPARTSTVKTRKADPMAIHNLT